MARRLFAHLAWVACICGGAGAAPSAAEPPPGGPATSTPRTPADVARWKLETVELRDGRKFEGLIRASGEFRVEFYEVVRRPGRPMHVVGRYFRPETIAATTKLPDDERRELRRRIREFIDSAGEPPTSERRLDEIMVDGQRRFQYAGHAFTLVSATDAELTRRSLDDVERAFAAYRLLLPERTKPSAPVTIHLFGSLAEHHEHLRGRGIAVKNPAYYSAEENSIAVGCELNAFATELLKTRRHNEQVIAGLQARLSAAAGADRAALERELKRARDTAEVFERKNVAQFHERTSVAFARLRHEAFHAYLETFVYPRRDFAVPAWLNEGAAQLFEAAQNEPGGLRIDAPDRDRLARLQESLRAAEPLPLTNVLAAQPRTFLVPHGSDAAASEQYYLYAWGLAYHLVFERQILGSPALDAYVARDAAPLDGDNAAAQAERFAKLVGQPVAEYEAAWRKYILSLKPRGG